MLIRKARENRRDDIADPCSFKNKGPPFGPLSLQYWTRCSTGQKAETLDLGIFKVAGLSECL